jgi:hypothetical protein
MAADDGASPDCADSHLLLHIAFGDAQRTCALLPLIAATEMGCRALQHTVHWQSCQCHRCPSTPFMTSAVLTQKLSLRFKAITSHPIHDICKSTGHKDML